MNLNLNVYLKFNLIKNDIFKNFIKSKIDLIDDWMPL